MIPLTVRSYRPHKGYALVAFTELPDINAAEPYKGAILCIDEADRHELAEEFVHGIHANGSSLHIIDGMSHCEENGFYLSHVRCVVH